MFKKVIVAAILATAAASSFAATPGFYVGADLGSTKVDGLSGDKTSVGAFAGYSFNQNFAVEGAYRRLGKWDVMGYSVDADQTAVSLIGTLPLNAQFNVYARLGYNNMGASASYGGIKASTSQNGGLYGVGVGYNFNKQISARVEVQKPASDTTNVNVGIVYSF
jgi:OOP family OmpA-OmpF porin